MAEKSAVKTTKEPKKAIVPNLSVRIQKLFDEDSKVKAVASANIGGAFAVHGIKVIDSEKGLFVSMPNEKWTDSDGKTKYKDTFHAVTAEARQELVDTVMSAYEQAFEKKQNENKDLSEDESMTQSM